MSGLKLLNPLSNSDKHLNLLRGLSHSAALFPAEATLKVYCYRVTISMINVWMSVHFFQFHQVRTLQLIPFPQSRITVITSVPLGQPFLSSQKPLLVKQIHTVGGYASLNTTVLTSSSRSIPIYPPYFHSFNLLLDPLTYIYLEWMASVRFTM